MNASASKPPATVRIYCADRARFDLTPDYAVAGHQRSIPRVRNPDRIGRTTARQVGGVWCCEWCGQPTPIAW